MFSISFEFIMVIKFFIFSIDLPCPSLDGEDTQSETTNYRIESSVQRIPSTRLYSKFCSNTCKHYSNNICISKHSFKACIYEYTGCMFIYYYFILFGFYYKIHIFSRKLLE